MSTADWPDGAGGTTTTNQNSDIIVADHHQNNGTYSIDPNEPLPGDARRCTPALVHADSHCDGGQISQAFAHPSQVVDAECSVTCASRSNIQNSTIAYPNNSQFHELGMVRTMMSNHQHKGARHFYTIDVHTVEFALPMDMQFVDYLGGGNYGNVIKVTMKTTTATVGSPPSSALFSNSNGSSSSIFNGASSSTGSHFLPSSTSLAGCPSATQQDLLQQPGMAPDALNTAAAVIQVDDEFAVKKLYEPFSNSVKSRRVYRELKLLQLLNHENIIRFVDIYTPDPDLVRFRNVYIVTEYAGISLKEVLDKQKSLGIRLINFDHVKYIVYQLLRALKYLHSANVIHRDLKPSNLAITEECDLTVLDFGLARTVATSDTLTGYVISRWYRSPEVIYWNNVSYNAKADVWSVGCILAELLTCRVLFPGSEAMEQYKLIIRLCGSPDEELMCKVEQQNSPAMRMVMERLGDSAPRQCFADVFRGCPPDAIDLLDHILVLDPDRRISVEQALQHPYMEQYSMPDDEPVAEQPLNIEDENADGKTLAEWKELIWNEIQSHYVQSGRPCFAQQQYQEPLNIDHFHSYR